MSDLTLRTNVVDQLEYEPSVHAANIGVTAENGIITLSGHVASYAEKQAALTAVKRVAGVRAIADDLRVRYPEDKKSSDDQIAKRALDILAWDTMIPSGSIQVMVRDGLVTLTGSVNWYYQKVCAEEDVRKLSGVRTIINDIEIKPKVEAKNVKQKIEDALNRYAEVEAQGIKITVQDGNRVVLEGKVKSWDERNAVDHAAWSAAGVKSVEDRLTVF